MWWCVFDVEIVEISENCDCCVEEVVWLWEDLVLIEVIVLELGEDEELMV